MSRPTTRSSRRRKQREIELNSNAEDYCNMADRCRRVDCEDRSLPVTLCSDLKEPMTKKYHEVLHKGGQAAV